MYDNDYSSTDDWYLHDKATLAMLFPRRSAVYNPPVGLGADAHTACVSGISNDDF